jgi:hypothetical protein
MDVKGQEHISRAGQQLLQLQRLQEAARGCCCRASKVQQQPVQRGDPQVPCAGGEACTQTVSWNIASPNSSLYSAGQTKHVARGGASKKVSDTMSKNLNQAQGPTHPPSLSEKGFLCTCTATIYILRTSGPFAVKVWPDSAQF